MNKTLRRIDPQASQGGERLVREIIVLTEPQDGEGGDGTLLLELADHAEPMGVLTNGDID